MTKSRGIRFHNPLTKVPPRQYSPDDIKARIDEAAARDAADTRTPAQVWLGDPPPNRSALAAVRSRTPAGGPRLQAEIGHNRKPVVKFG